MQISSVMNGSLSLGSTPTKTAKSPGGYYDPADTNQDGVVSAAERRAYELKHPEQAYAKRLQSASTNQTGTQAETSLAKYTAQGLASSTSGAVSGTLDIYA